VPSGQIPPGAPHPGTPSAGPRRQATADVSASGAESKPAPLECPSGSDGGPVANVGSLASMISSSEVSMRQAWLVVVVLMAVPMGAGTGIAAGPTTGAEGTQITAPGGIYHQIGPTALKAMLAQKDFTFVNVHIPYEGEIAQTDAHVPYDQVGQADHAFPGESEREDCPVLPDRTYEPHRGRGLGATGLYQP